MTGRIIIDIFSTLDGVGQGPGGPDEDTSGGFEFGGWQAPFPNGHSGEQIMRGIRAMDALLLGRRTYDIFAAYWPQLGDDNPIASKFNAIPKYVASRRGVEPSWSGSKVLGPDLAAEVDSLRERHAEIHVIGSLEFARTLVTEGLFDELNLWVYPIALGSGKRLFPDDGAALSLTLLSAEPDLVSGAVLLRYGPGHGRPGTGDMT
ncbi:dihydrofolate reductase family protein [Subtercola boreus]|uniref:Deaminase n=1 Tax=Subtercola boreus TaxID=120213 RepID=A0A3E0W8I0_9MICO|nr:dihydrofolate reductase family protein [Subtercola boreus]RFA18129.1 deaminase [Subtercola boreus]RFA18511.1 deaminase [Subtercola boreus]RFA25039.1 deaminase [Subtercola boreus]